MKLSKKPADTSNKDLENRNLPLDKTDKTAIAT